MRTANIYHLHQSSERVQPLLPHRDAVLRAIEAARYAPEAGHSEPWRFYLIGRDTAEAIAWIAARRVELTHGTEAARREFDKWRTTPGCVVVTCASTEENATFERDLEDCCTATQKFVLSLWSEDINTEWVTHGVTDEPQFFDVLGISQAEERVVGLVWYGQRIASASASVLPLSHIVRQLP